jgi:phthalate 4,5-dioxygenase reductase subunit
MSSGTEFLEAVVVEKSRISSEFCTLKLRVDDDAPPFAPGAHTSLQTPFGWRNYSLANLADGNIWEVGVKAERDGRGASSWIVDTLEEGETIQCQVPENTFPLHEADRYLLIAGGIGVTAVLPMARALDRAGKGYQFIYCVRDRQDAAFVDEVEALKGDITIHCDQGEEDGFFDFWPLVETPDDRLVYCCGPKIMMEDLEDMTGHWPDHHINFEDFKPVEILNADDVAFAVELQNGRQLDVMPGETILQVLRAHGLETRSSCESGTCGSCRTSYLAGEVEHRDLVLTDDEKAHDIMICVSRAKGVVVLDV